MRDRFCFSVSKVNSVNLKSTSFSTSCTTSNGGKNIQLSVVGSVEFSWRDPKTGSVWETVVNGNPFYANYFKAESYPSY